MDKENRISRRSALKRIGAAVLGGAAAASGMLPAVSCSQQGKKRIIFYFTGTGNKHIPENLERLKEDIAARRHWHEPVTEEERQMHRRPLPERAHFPYGPQDGEQPETLTGKTEKICSGKSD